MTAKDLEKGFKELMEEAINEPGIISECYSQFHNYSIGNIMEIYLQCRMNKIQFGPIAGYKKWKELGRQVSKGQKKQFIWFPQFGKFPSKVCEECDVPKDQHDGTGHEFKAFMVRYIKGFDYKPGVFVLSQTEEVEGAEYVPQETPEFDFEQMRENLGITEVDFDHGDGNAQGFANPDEMQIAINPVAKNPLKTEIHEVAHCLIGKNGGSYSDGEVLAEMVAYIVVHALGLDGATESRGYIQGWMNRGGEFSEADAQKALGTANKILLAGRIYA